MRYSLSLFAPRGGLLLLATYFAIIGAVASASVVIAADAPPAASVAPVAVAPAAPTAATPASVPVRIASIEVRGNVATPTDAILAAIGMKAGDEIAYDKLQARVQDSLAAIASIGTIADPTASMEQFRNGMTLTYKILENPKVTAVEIKDNSLVPSAELTPLLTSKVGSVADRSAISKDLEALGKYYQGKGYSLGDVKVQMDDSGKLIYALVESHIGSIKITGNTKTKGYVIERELISKQGDALDTNKIRAELRRLYNLGFFAEVNPKIEPGDKPDLVNYTIELKEQKSGRFGGSIAYAVNEGLLGSLMIENPNVAGRGQGLNLNVEAGIKGDRTLEAGFTEPRLRGTRTSFDLKLFSKDSVETDYAAPRGTTYTEHRTGGNMLFGFSLAENDKASAGIGSEYTTNRQEDGSAYHLTGEGRTNYIDLGYTRDTRDNVLDSKSGYRLNASARLAGGILQGGNDFVRYQGSLSTYKKVFGNLVLAGRVSTGQVRFAGEAPPAQEVFRLGGADTVRGYDYGAMHGDTMAYSNVELRIPSAKAGTSLVVFADAGNAWAAADGAGPAKIGAGIGARFNTPLGPLRLDYGWGKDSSADKLRGKLHFSFGQTF